MRRLALALLMCTVASCNRVPPPVKPAEPSKDAEPAKAPETPVVKIVPAPTNPDPDLHPAQNVQAKPGPRCVEITWDGAVDPYLMGYRVYRKGPDDDTFKPLADAPGPQARSLTVRDLSNGATYEFYVIWGVTPVTPDSYIRNLVQHFRMAVVNDDAVSLKSMGDLLKQTRGNVRKVLQSEIETATNPKTRQELEKLLSEIPAR